MTLVLSIIIGGLPVDRIIGILARYGQGLLARLDGDTAPTSPVLFSGVPILSGLIILLQVLKGYSLTLLPSDSGIPILLGLIAHYGLVYRYNQRGMIGLLIGIYSGMTLYLGLLFVASLALSLGVQSLRVGTILGCGLLFGSILILNLPDNFLILNTGITLSCVAFYWDRLIQYVDAGSTTIDRQIKDWLRCSALS